MRFTHLMTSLLLLAAGAAQAGQWDTAALQASLDKLGSNPDGKLGACVQIEGKPICTHGDERFPMQSVAKTAIAIAVMRAVDEHRLSLTQTVALSRKDMSVWAQPIADKLKHGSYRTTVAELLDYMMMYSDNAAADTLDWLAGGPGAIQGMLAQAGLEDIHFDRDERHMQTDIVGLHWQAEFTNVKTFKNAVAAVPAKVRQASLDAYMKDPRDTATPVAMAALLGKLQHGELLSQASTQYLVSLMARCNTGTDRLKAGLPEGWKLGHKTGTSGRYQDFAAATNDVGLVTTPDGDTVPVVAFVAGARQDDDKIAARIADVTRAVVASYKPAASKP